MKNIQIPQELFIRLIRFHLFDMDEDADLIKKGLEDKMERLARHEIYSKSKTASSEEEKEKLVRNTWIWSVCIRISDGDFFLGGYGQERATLQLISDKER